MPDLVLTLIPEVRERLEALAIKLGKSVEECGQLALSEFMDNWEDYMRTVRRAGKRRGRAPGAARRQRLIVAGGANWPVKV